MRNVRHFLSFILHSNLKWGPVIEVDEMNDIKEAEE